MFKSKKYKNEINFLKNQISKLQNKNVDITVKYYKLLKHIQDTNIKYNIPYTNISIFVTDKINKMKENYTNPTYIKIYEEISNEILDLIMERNGEQNDR